MLATPKFIAQHHCPIMRLLARKKCQHAPSATRSHDAHLVSALQLRRGPQTHSYLCDAQTLHQLLLAGCCCCKTKKNLKLATTASTTAHEKGPCQELACCSSPHSCNKQSSWRWAHDHDPAVCCLGTHRGRVTLMRTWFASSHADSERFSCASASTQWFELITRSASLR